MSLSVSSTTNRSIALAFIVFMIVAGWYGQQVIGDLGSWNDWDKPAEVAKMWKGCIFGMCAFLLALGVDIKQLLGPFGSFLPGGPTNTVSDQKRAELNEKAGG